jgi:hypothetical protein
MNIPQGILPGENSESLRRFLPRIGAGCSPSAEQTPCICRRFPEWFSRRFVGRFLGQFFGRFVERFSSHFVDDFRQFLAAVWFPGFG